MAATRKTEARGPKIKWGVAVDLKRCTGCQACTIACKLENGTPPGVFWTRVLEKEEGTFPFAYKTFIPQRCNHCAEPPCVEVCPTGASYVREQDNLVLINQDACIGCHACVVACPYQARFIPASSKGYYDELTPYESASYNKWQPGTARSARSAFTASTGSAAGLRGDLPHQGVDIRRSERPAQRNFEADSERPHFQPQAELGTDPCVYYLT